MKVKVSLSGESIQQFFVGHCEKLGLALIGILCIGLIYKGYSREVSKITPEDIQNINDQAQQNIQNTTWSNVKTERVQDIDFRQKAENVLQPISSTVYQIGPLRELMAKPQTKRIDPELYAVEELEVVAGFGPIALRDRNRSKNSKSGIGMGAGLGLGGLFLSPEETEDGVILLRQLDTSEREKFEGKQERGSFSGAFRGGFQSGAGNKAEAHSFVSILGLVPIRRQMNEYDRCFKEADGYHQQRDTPNYVYHYIRRREIASDGTPGKWKEDFNARKAVTIANRWPNPAPEIAEPTYLFQTGGAGGRAMGMGIGMERGGASVWGKSWPGLHWPLPPLLLGNIKPYALHSKVPAMQTQTGFMTGVQMEQEEFDPEEIIEDAPDELNLPNNRRTRLENGIMGGRSDSMGPSAGGMGIGRGYGQNSQIADFYLFRVFDFEVVPGTTYQYQVRILLEDPNNPRNPGFTPPENVLHLDVVKRRRESKEKKLKYFRSAEWSEISSAVTVPDGRSTFVGTPQPLRTYTFNHLKYDKGPTHTKVTAVVWDSEKQHNVFHSETVTRGSAINLKGKDFMAIHPASASVRQITEDYNLRTDMFILDLRGGHDLPGRESELLETAEMLLLNADGQLSFRRETDDYALQSGYDIDVNDAIRQRNQRELMGPMEGGFGPQGPGGLRSGSGKDRLQRKKKR